MDIHQRNVKPKLKNNKRSLLNERLVSDVRLVKQQEMVEFAEEVCASPLLLGKYLNMLSLLEFIGARALINTFATQVENNETNLKHVLEEARHSLTLRKMGEKLARRKLEYNDDGVFTYRTSDYFIKRMIAHVHNDLMNDPDLKQNSDKRHRFVILYVSGILEVRAVWWYTIFNAEIFKRNYKINFNQVLLDEEGHISSIDEEISATDPLHIERLEKYFVKEESLFAQYFADQKSYLAEHSAKSQSNFAHA